MTERTVANRRGAEVAQGPVVVDELSQSGLSFQHPAWHAAGLLLAGSIGSETMSKRRVPVGTCCSCCCSSRKHESFADFASNNWDLVFSSCRWCCSSLACSSRFFAVSADDR